MSRHRPAARDHIEIRREQWRKELPDVDTTGMAILGRARIATLLARRPIEKVFSEHGLDAGEFDVLATLLRTGSPYLLRPTELYNSLMISSGGLTDRLARLERLGLVRRRANEQDARSLLVELTTKGRRVGEAAFRQDMQVELALLSGLSEAERKQLSFLLARLVSTVSQACGECGEDGLA